MSHPGQVDPDLFLCLLLTPPADQQAFGQRLVEQLDARVPELAPNRWGFGDPSMPPDRSQLLRVWHSGIMWDGAGWAGVHGSFFVDRRLPYAEVQVRSPFGVVEGDRAAELLQGVAAAEGGVYGFVHRLLPSDLATSERQTASITHLGPPMNANVRKLGSSGLPNVWWANVFGPPLVELLGAERIATAPAYAVGELGAGLWYLQLTESILDNETDPEGFEDARARVKAHLGADAFYDPLKGADGAYRVIALPEPAPRKRRTGGVRRISGFGPAGYLDVDEVKGLWEPWARGTSQPDVWDLLDLPSDALIALAELLADEQLDVEVNQIPPLSLFVQVAREVPDARFSGLVCGPAAGTESLSVEQVWVPDTTVCVTVDQASKSADRDDLDDRGDRTVTWS
jgi:hypothetical protein